jgi:hypothetical protein
MTDAGEALFRPIRESVVDAALDGPGRRAVIVKGELGGNATFYGIAHYAQERRARHFAEFNKKQPSDL